MAQNRKIKLGTSYSEDVRKLIIDFIIENGGDLLTGDLPAALTLRSVSKHFGVGEQFVSKVWRTFCENGETTARKADQTLNKATSKLGNNEITFIEFLKRQQPSISIAEIKDELNQHANIPGGISSKTISDTVRNKLSGGNWTFKKLTKVKKDKFAPDNLRYCQAFVNYMQGVPPEKVKFFDEAGVHVNMGVRQYGHSQVGTPAIEVVRGTNGANVSLNALVGLEGILYANTIDGATNTQEFLRFFGEAADQTTNYGSPVLEYGDHIILDNCATHQHEGREILTEWLNDMGIYAVYTPFYSPELNAIEFVFNKIKTCLKQRDLRDILFYDVHRAIYQALQRISEDDMIGFYQKVSYLNI